MAVRPATGRTCGPVRMADLTAATAGAHDDRAVVTAAGRAGRAMAVVVVVVVVLLFFAGLL